MSQIERQEKIASMIEEAHEEEKKDKEQLLQEEVAEAFKEEVGEDWLAYEPLHKRIAVQFMRIFFAMTALYFFLVSLELMGSSFTALSGKASGGLFGGNTNPIIGLMVGILATVLVQSSSTTTSIIVVLVGNDVIDLDTAIPMVMGANIGTSITNTIVSLGFADDPVKYERGFAGATVHDMFNFLNVLVLLPVELIVSAINGGKGGLLHIIAEGLAKGRGDKELEGGDSFKESNPIKKITSPIIDKMISINKDVISDYAQGFPAAPTGDALLNCELTFTFEDEETGMDEKGCPDFTCDFCPEGIFNETLYTTANKAFDEEKLIDGGAFEKFGDGGGGVFVLIISLLMLIFSLGLIVKMLTSIVQGSAQKILVKTLNYDFVGGDYLSILVGCGITFVVQSSSITTSILTPLVAIGALKIEGMFPYTLGANIGTTGTGLIAAAASGKQEGYAIALVHLFFNVLGVLIWYPIPFMRNIPLTAARTLGKGAAMWRMIPVIYILLAFIFYPLILFAFAEGFAADKGGKAVTAIAVTAFGAAHIYTFYWYHRRDGRAKAIAFIEARKAAVEEKQKARQAAIEDEKRKAEETM